MTIKITPLFDTGGLDNLKNIIDQQLEFEGYVKEIMKLGFSMKLLHYSDGSVLLHKLTKEEIQILSKSNG